MPLTKYYKVLKPFHGPQKNFMRLPGGAHQVGDIVCADEVEGSANMEAGFLKEATKKEIEKVKK